MSIFNRKPKTDNELQAELRALVERGVADEYYSFTKMDRYESLLKEIYSRGLEPCVKFAPLK